MDTNQQRFLQTVIGVAIVMLLSVSLAALSVIRADQSEGELVAAGDPGAFDTPAQGGEVADSPGTTDPTTGTGDATTGSETTTPTGGSGQSPGGQQPAGGGDGTAPPSSQPPQANGGQCTDYNPDEGVFCDRWLVGGTTILSGPLAIYGEQGLKGGQAWIEYFRRTLAPELGVRPSELFYYDDNLEPRKTLQFTQKLVEEDKVLLIAGVTNPAAVAGYLEEKGVAFIGDLGLNPGSYESSSIFPTSAPFEVSFQLRARTAKRNGASSISVIQDVLPASDPAEFERLWELAAEREGLELLSFQPIDSQANTCDSKMLNVIRERPEWVMLPVAAAPMLGCMREASSQQYKPGAAIAGPLINWSGGSNLAFEVEQCGSQCHGMFSGGTPFLDPRTNPSEQAKIYLDNMARYSPGIDVTGFIAINYYHAGLLQFEVMRQGDILHNLSRATVLAAAEGFGPFETGFGNTVEWKAGQIPRIPTTCGYEVILDPDERRWVFQSEKLCL